jgi:4,5-DOPA dioxygenase extradiol
MLAVEDSPAGRFLDGLGGTMPRPRAIIIASAHFLTDRPMLGAHPQPHTVHDFGGFPEQLYGIHYPARGDPTLAEDVAKRIAGAGLPVKVREGHGLDHGVWVPLRRMYPQADIPVVPLSIQPHADATAHYRLGQALAGLASEGVLVIGSGGFVHNLGELAWGQPDAPMPEWARVFRDWMRDRVKARDIDALLDWERQAPDARHAHPTPEHLLPLFVALGAAEERGGVRHLHDSHEYGSLALDAFAFG